MERDRRDPSERQDRIGKGSEHVAVFQDKIQQLLGPEASDLEVALGSQPPVSIRLNATKWSLPSKDPVPWCTSGQYLAERPAFTFDPLFHAGCYYVQEPASMLLEQAFLASGLSGKDIIALDLCAAPGGKTTHLRSLLSSSSLLVANEIDRKRQFILQENLWKWGAANTVICGSDPRDLDRLPEFFDLIMVDAPCSGEGMFRKDAFARAQWSPALVQHCCGLQRTVLQHAWQALKPGGTLFYSTCTWETAENEDQMAELIAMGAVPIKIPVEPAWGMRMGVDGLGLRCYPHKVRGEGFFIAALRKPGIHVEERLIGPLTDNASQPEMAAWLNEDRPWQLVEHDQIQFAIDGQHITNIRSIANALRVLSPGVPLAEKKGDEWRPHAALALAGDRSTNVFPEIALSYDQALAYLRGTAIPAKDARGTALATYNGHGLGWLRGAGNRWNNLLPASWRIKAQRPIAPNVPWAPSHR
ncbi:MAG: hypothetical protein KBA60_09335 [Flavobacteriales bacterium]|nr:hypothetical protein [Flavobacteriales bacterium]